MRSFGDTYRPEKYYMRGPGPKWHAKHAGALVAAASAQPHAGSNTRAALLDQAGSSVAGWIAPTAAAAALGFMAAFAFA